MKSYHPGPSMLLGIRSRDRRYGKLWKRIRRRDRAYRLEEARQKRLNGKSEMERQGMLRWKAANRKRVKKYNRAYYRALGYTCHFCGKGGSKKHPLRPVTRHVSVGGHLVERRVRICFECRGAKS